MWPQIAMASLGVTAALMLTNEEKFFEATVGTGCFHWLLYMGGFYDVFFRVQ